MQRSIHVWHHCHECGSAPLAGTRHHCRTCPAGPDTDLCDACYRRYLRGDVRHPSENSPVRLAGNHAFAPFEGEPSSRYHRWLEVPQPPARPPLIPERALVRPEFCHARDSAFGGYGFIVATAHGRLMLTALHVLDEVIRKHDIDATLANAAYTGEELPRIITRVNLYDVTQDRWMLHPLGEARRMLVLPEARTGLQEPVSYRDISAFAVDDTAALKPLALAAAAPAVGEPIWLAARMPDASRTRLAVVVERSDASCVFRFADSGEGPKFTSGAPLVNGAGQVVGINVGGGTFEGRRFGHANPVEHVHRHLAGERFPG